MDRLDEQIMAAKKQYKPSKDFTRSTMKKINTNTDKQNNFNWLKAFALSGMALLAILVTGFGFLHMNGNVSQKSTNTVATTTSPPTSSQAPAKAQTAAQTAANEINTDLAQLDKEVSSYTVSYLDTALDNINQ
jgi:hypothetical protein